MDCYDLFEAKSRIHNLFPLDFDFKNFCTKVQSAQKHVPSRKWKT